ncbi:MAG TPA: flagellar filament outer layer protein FlaA [Spirochaetales bacterium]|nr:flagellar filament outer layer protein FlaA [Spirochaetales bacterium]HOV38510.1 flagellar filament outer layer protein FlaA [Spirochaetales bacterium]
MERISRLLGCLLLFFLLVPAIFADEMTTNLQSIIVEDFDNPEASPWFILGSKFSSVIKTDAGEDVYPKMAFVKTWPEALYKKPPEGKDLYVLGVHGKFDRKGYNFIEIIPGQKDSEGKWVPRTISLPGRVKNMDVWVWGSNFDYYLEAHIMDYRGITHVLNFGDIKHIGWKNLGISIPNYVPQSISYIPKYKGLQLVKFVLWTKPHERVDDFYVYLDQIKIFSDVFESPFDGEDLANPEYAQKLWSEAQGK